MIEHDEFSIITERNVFEKWLIQHPAMTIFGLCMFVFFALFVMCALLPRW